MEELDDLDTGTDVDLWDHKIAAEMRQLQEIFAEVVDKNARIADKARILDPQGKVVKDYSDTGTAGYLEFEIAGRRAVLHAGGQRQPHPPGAVGHGQRAGVGDGEVREELPRNTRNDTERRQEQRQWEALFSDLPAFVSVCSVVKSLLALKRSRTATGGAPRCGPGPAPPRGAVPQVADALGDQPGVGLLHGVSSIMTSTTATAMPRRRRLPSAMAVSTVTSGSTASAVASRGRRWAVSTTSWANVSPSVSSARASVSRMRCNCSAPRRVSTTSGSSRWLSLDVARRASRRLRGVRGSLVPALGADALGGVAGVGDQADLLAHQEDGVDQRHGGGDGQFAAERLAARVVAVRVEVEQDGDAGERRGLVDLAVQLRRCGRWRRQWTRLSGSPCWYWRTPAMRVGSSNRRCVMRTSPIGRREAMS